MEDIQREIEDLKNKVAEVERVDPHWATNANSGSLIASFNIRIAALINEKTQLQGKIVYLNFTHICPVRLFILVSFLLSNRGGACVRCSCDGDGW